MNKNSVSPRFKKKFFKNSMAKSVIYKSIFAIAVFLLVLLFTKLNTNPTNRLLETIKTNINYEFHVRDDSVRIYHKVKDMFNSTLESIPVFNTAEKLAPPVTGTVFRSFDSEIETPKGTIINGGVEIKLENEMEPKSIVDGRITKIEKRDSKGTFITVEEGNIKIIYGYLQSTFLKEGDLVRKGDAMGEVGLNKDGSKYLRLELYIDDEQVDPEKFIDF